MLPVQKIRKPVATRARPESRIIDLRKLGLVHAAPRENGRPLMTFRLDPHGGLRPAA